MKRYFENFRRTAKESKCTALEKNCRWQRPLRKVLAPAPTYIIVVVPDDTSGNASTLLRPFAVLNGTVKSRAPMKTLPDSLLSREAREPESRNPLSLTRSGAEYDYRVAKDAQMSSEMSPMLLLSAKVSMLLNFFLGEAPTGGFFRNGGSTG